MRRRKGNRGRPRKVKKGRSAKLRETIPLDSKLSEDNSEDGTTSLKSDGAVTGFIGLDKTGPFSYRVGSVNIELEGSDEDIKPVIEENDIKLEVECGSNTAYMFLSRLCQGSKGSCIEFDGAWLTPNEFQFVSGRETAKDWKRSIRHFGRSLKLLITKGILTVHPAACRCDSCRLLSTTTNEPSLVKEKRERDAREKKARGIDGGASGSDKEGGESRGSAEDGDDESGDAEDSQGSAENGEEESGSEEEEDDGKVEENNNEAGDKDSEDSDGSSSSSDSSSSSSDSDSDNDGEKKDEDEDENKDKAKAEVEEAMEEDNVDEEKEEESSPVKISEDNADDNLKTDTAAGSEKMEVDAEEDIKEHGKAELSEVPEQHVSCEQMDSPKDVADEEHANDDFQDTNTDHVNTESEEMPLPANLSTTSKHDEDASKDALDEDSPMDDIKPENDDEDDRSQPTSKPEPAPENIHTAITDVNTPPDKADSVNGSSNDATIAINTDNISKDNAKNSEDVCLDKPSSQKDEGSRGSMSSTPSEDAVSTLSSQREQSPLTMKRSTPTLSEIPLKKSSDKPSSSGGKSRLSNIIDLLRTSKEKETKQQVAVDRPEEKRQDKRLAEVKDTKPISPLPSKRDETRSRKPEREEPAQPKPSREDQKMSQKAHDAMRLPMGGRLPFGFPPPELLERASRDAHEQLSKSHRQFERNLETLMAQNMNPFVPELSMFSLPEHRAQMEYNYLKNMERLDQMAKERMASMADLRHQQMLRQHNSFVAKLAEQQTKSTRHELSESHQKSSSREKDRDRERESRKSQPQQSKRTPTREETPKVPSAHRAQPEVRKDKPDQRSLQTPPAAHHNKPTSRPSSAGSKPPSSLPLPASTGRAAHPSGPSSTHSRNSPMIAPIAPPLQIWSSCFPYVIPPPTMEMQRLTQFFPNLNGGLFTADGVSKRDSESPILDLSTKKRKHDDREQAVRRKQAKLLSGSNSVHSSPQTNGTVRNSSQSRPQNSKDSPLSRPQHTKDADSAKERPFWGSHERISALTCTCALQHLNDIKNWSVDDVCCFLKGLEGCSLYIDSFRRHGIDGSTLMMLTTETLTNSLGMRIAAATFLTESVAKRARDLQKIVPCEYCRIRNQKI